MLVILLVSSLSKICCLFVSWWCSIALLSNIFSFSDIVVWKTYSFQICTCLWFNVTVNFIYYSNHMYMNIHTAVVNIQHLTFYSFSKYEKKEINRIRMIYLDWVFSFVFILYLYLYLSIKQYSCQYFAVGVQCEFKLFIVNTILKATKKKKKFVTVKNKRKICLRSLTIHKSL